MSRREYVAPGTEEEDDLVARSREWMNRNKRDREWMRSVDDFLESSQGRLKSSKSRSRSRSPRSRSRSRSRSRDRRDRRESHTGSEESDDSGDYRRFMGGERKPGSRRDDRRSRRRDRRHSDWNTEEEYYNHYDDEEKGEDGEWLSADQWEDDNDSTANSEYECRRFNTHLMELTSGEDRYAYRNQQPQKTIVIRGLPQYVTEADIRADIINCGIQFRDIRLVRRKDTGASRGFAFVEFFNPEGSQKWIETRLGQLTLKDQSRALMQYSFPGKFMSKKPLLQKDWFCRCQAYNFNRRMTCYRCNVSRKQGEVEVEAGAEEVSTFPTNTVLLRGLDALTTEESVLKSIKIFSSLPIRSVRIGRDPVTHASLCICYLEMNSVVDSVSLYNTLKDTELIIEDRRVSVSYAKLAPLGGPSNSKGSGPRMADAALAAAQWSHQLSDDSKANPSAQYTLSDVPRLAEYSAALYASNPQEKAAYLKYYEDYYKKQITDGNSIQMPVTGSVAPTVYSAPAVKSTGPLTEAPDGLGNEKYPTPDVSTYQYDKTSGYYYDPYTTLYYDANSQYYFNSKVSKFLYWDAAKSTYLPAPTTISLKNDSQPSGSNSEENRTIEDKDDDSKKEPEKEKDKIKVAKRIAKDMAKWAKTLNHKKEIAKQNIVAAQNAAAAQAKVQGSADIGYAVLERKELSTSALYNSSVDSKDSKREGLVAAYSQGSDSEEEQSLEEARSGGMDEQKHVDVTKKVCILCKRQFPSLDVLQKHVQMSDLHRQNLVAWYRNNGLEMPDEDSAQKKIMQYRDRAKERRLKFGEPETPRPSHLKEQYIKAMESTYEEPTKQGIGSDNLGNKLLQKMGWREGTGLGKTNQGRTDIIQAESRSKSAGLGAKSGSIYTPGPGETYRDCVKKMARMRYNELKD